MKRTINAILGMAVMAILLSSCGAESDILGQFSKRKYLKKAKATKHYELAKTDRIAKDDVVVLAESETSMEPVVAEPVAKQEEVALEKFAEPLVKVPVISNKINKDWSAYNRNFVSNPALEGERITTWAYANEFQSTQRASDVVLVILCIFLPPVAVIIYEDTVTGNFWLDLVLTFLFWVPGMVYAFLVCFADVSI